VHVQTEKRVEGER
jgi:pyruvate dehydrogenase E2 component (dihydrolipoamide acetyltransferase)